MRITGFSVDLHRNLLLPYRGCYKNCSRDCEDLLGIGESIEGQNFRSFKTDRDVHLYSVDGKGDFCGLE